MELALFFNLSRMIKVEDNPIIFDNSGEEDVVKHFGDRHNIEVFLPERLEQLPIGFFHVQAINIKPLEYYVVVKKGPIEELEDLTSNFKYAKGVFGKNFEEINNQVNLYKFDEILIIHSSKDNFAIFGLYLGM